jgi:hypothetical protein
MKLLAWLLKPSPSRHFPSRPGSSWRCAGLGFSGQRSKRAALQGGVWKPE